MLTVYRAYASPAHRDLIRGGRCARTP
jgi:hypothetical protein